MELCAKSQCSPGWFPQQAGYPPQPSSSARWAYAACRRSPCSHTCSSQGTHIPPTDHSVMQCTLIPNQAWSCLGYSICKVVHGHEQLHKHKRVNSVSGA